MAFGLVNYKVGGVGPVNGGVVKDQGLYNLGDLLGRNYRTLKDAYGEWDRVESALEALDFGMFASLPLTTVQFLPPSMEPASIYFAGFNYHDHVANMEKATGMPVGTNPKALGLKPWHNLKPRSTLCGHGSQIELPSEKVDWEVELAVVIGRRARRVAIADALSHVAGYTVAVDISVRDLALRAHTPVGSPARFDWIVAKGMEGFCPLGPLLTPRSQIADPQNLKLGLNVNGVVKQNSSTAEMIYSVAEAIAHLSELGTLLPGDIILTGTPAGVGAETGEFLKPGDVITAWVESIGELRAEMVAWQGGSVY